MEEFQLVVLREKGLDQPQKSLSRKIWIGGIRQKLDLAKIFLVIFWVFSIFPENFQNYFSKKVIILFL